jgi:putative tricarboxylic transport membrane protein
MKRSFSRLAAAVSAVVAVSAVSVHAEGAKDSGGAGKLNFPRRAIEMVVPFGPGGSSDMMTRTVAQLMKKYIDKPINVVNKAGGGTTDGMVYANGQEADGHTILQVTPSLPIIEAQNRAPVKFSENFIPIGNFQIDIQSFGVSAKNRNFKTLEEMIAYAKANPGKVKIGGTSPGGLDD